MVLKSLANMLKKDDTEKLKEHILQDLNPVGGVDIYRSVGTPQRAILRISKVKHDGGLTCQGPPILKGNIEGTFKEFYSKHRYDCNDLLRDRILFSKLTGPTTQSVVSIEILERAAAYQVDVEYYS